MLISDSRFVTDDNAQKMGNNKDYGGTGGYTVTDGSRGYIVVYAGYSGLTGDNDNTIPFDFSKYNKICAEILLYSPIDDVSSGGIGYASTLDELHNDDIFVDGSSLTNDKAGILTLDISNINSENYIIIASPYGDGSYASIENLWFE